MAHNVARAVLAAAVMLAAQGSWAGASAAPPDPRADYDVPGAIASTKTAVDAAGRITSAYSLGGRILVVTSAAAGASWTGTVDVGGGSEISSVATSRGGTAAVAWIDGGIPRVAVQKAAGGGWATRKAPRTDGDVCPASRISPPSRIVGLPAPRAHSIATVASSADARASVIDDAIGSMPRSASSALRSGHRS